MFVPEVSNESWLSRLVNHLENEKYCSQAAKRCTAVAKRFLSYLEKRCITVEAAQPSDVELYLRSELRLYRERHGRSPASTSGWCCSHTNGVHMLLRLVHGQWPPLVAPSTDREIFHNEVTNGYAEWMSDLRGLAPETTSGRCAEALRFLHWLGAGGTQENLSQIAVADVNSYLKFRVTSLRRLSLRGVTTNLRSFLRYLHATGRTTLDLTAAVIGPTLYAFESIPSALRAEDVKRVLETTRQDRSPIGRRDYAILMLLATYGLRAGEVTALRLKDIDWRHETMHIRHSKTGAHSELPLLAAVGDAILRYLQSGRPKVTFREVFIRSRAPYRPFQSGSSLYTPIRGRLAAAGVTSQGKKGPHTFRHARAVSMLRAAVPIKKIGDILGHRSVDSTAAYLKLATEDLRAVALEVPTEVRA